MYSTVPYAELSVEIDFDEASREWRANKKKNKDGSFSYICGVTRSNGKVCTKVNCKNVQHSKQKMTEISLES